MGDNSIQLVAEGNIAGSGSALFNLSNNAIDEVEALAVCFLNSFLVGEISLRLNKGV